MRSNTKPMLGHKFGTRTVVSYFGKKKWNVQCECGKTVALAGADIRRGRGGLGCVCPATALYRFNQKITQGKGECMLWTGCLSEDGYGSFRDDGSTHLAHRWNWIRVNEPVPSGRELDHKCRVRNCVNPDHLEPVTHHENVLRGDLGKVTEARFAAKRRALARQES